VRSVVSQSRNLRQSAQGVAVDDLVAEVLTILRPPPALRVSDWAERFRVLNPETAAEPGRWSNDRAPYQRGIMDAIHEPGVQQIIVMSSAQVGKTEIALNILGYHVQMDPCPILIVVPTLEIAKHYAQDRIIPMFRDCPTLGQKLYGKNSRRRGQHTFHIPYSGGHITISGANSPASLATRPIRLLILDEVDRFPACIGSEGDPIALARKRTQAYWNRKIVMISTPTIQGVSRIERAYQQSDQRRFYVSCPHCGAPQILQFENLQWSENNPDTARYICAHCRQPWTDKQKIHAIRRGEWRKGNPDIIMTAGFHLSELYSPWATWASIVKAYLEAKTRQEELRVFHNTVLGQTWSEINFEDDLPPLRKRTEEYGPKLPEQVCLLTAATDVQEDRLEVLVVGWGEGEEAWHIERKLLFGSPVGEGVWEQLDRYLTETTWEHPSGARLKPEVSCIDSGFLSKRVYDFVRARQRRRIYAIKGISTPGAPLVGRPMRAGRSGIRLYPVAVAGAKDILFARLQIEKPGPGYIHFNKQCDDDYFDQLTAERPIVKVTRGVAVRQWQKIRDRNEVLDLWVYNLAALAILNPDFKLVRKFVLAPRPQKVKSKPEKIKKKKPRGGWVRGW